MIKILTDSTSDISKEYAKENDIAVVPLRVNFKEEQYLDGIDLTPEEFIVKLEKSDKLPTTSQPSPEDFIKHFEKAKENGDTLICLFISKALSGTNQSARIAKDEVGHEDIYIIDSKNVAMALGLLVKYAVELVKSGKFTAQEIADELKIAREHLHLYAIVNDLTYLRKGGRLSGAAAFAGGLLGIKPVVGINGVDQKEEGHNGKLELKGKARGLPGAYVTIFKFIEKTGGINKAMGIEVGYTGDKSKSEPFVRYISQNLKMDKPDLGPIGAVVGTHAGPGACGIAFFDSKLNLKV